MHVTNRPKIVKLALNTLTAAVASAVLMSSAAYAAGLGKLTVLSSLGQPLRAEIELTAVTEDESRNLVAKLAPPEAFRLANIEFNPALMSLRFNVEQRNGRQFIRVTSTQPLNEPFVDMLLELTWDNGKLVREYTFLLDPAELKATQPAQAAVAGQPLPAAASQPTPAAAQRPARTAPAAQQAPADSATEVKVRPGDTLGKIAARVKPAEVSLDMMLVALYRANPDAFLGNNMNRLKTGTILTVPDADTIMGSGNAGEARGVVIAHAADFNAYRSKLAGQVAAATPAQVPEAAQSAAGKIAAKVEERPTAVTGAKDQLKLSKATTGNAAGANTAAAEDRIAKEQQLAEATARVRELEKNVSDLEKLMALKGKPLPAKPAAEEPAASAPAEASAPAPAPKKPVAKPVKTPAPKEPGIVDMIMDNLVVIGGAALAILLGAYAVIARRRNPKPAAKAVVEPSILGAPTTEQAHTMFAETGGQSVDTNNSVFNSSFAPSASQLDTNEVDPVAEADVYIAYGRDAQAEEILKEALRTHPERIPVRLKLLEIYAARKDTRAFESQATEVYSMTKGQGDEWAQAAALGLTIDPTNPLYAGAASAPAFPSDAERDQQAMLAQELQASSAMDMDLGMDMPLDTPATAAPTAAPAPAAEDHSLDFDLGGLSFTPGGAETPAAPAPVAAAAAPAMAADPLPDLGMDLDLTAVPTDAPAPASESLADMSFDLSFDTPPAADEAPAPSGKDMTTLDELSMDTPAAASDDFAMADLAKEFDLPSTPAASNTATAVPDPLADLDAMNFDIPAIPAAEAPAPATAPSLSMDDLGLDLPDLGEAPTPAPTAAVAMDFDMSSIDLDLPATPAPEAAPAAEPTPAADLDLMAGFDLPSAEVAAEAAIPANDPPSPVEASLDDLSLPDMDLGSPAAEAAEPGEMSAQHMEMETKLDLAIAYQEIGDKEGARELIEEVIKGGSPEQVAKANELRVQLA